MKRLRITSYGIRGFVGESLDPKMLADFSQAFATFLSGGRVLVGRDTRHSSPMVHTAVLSALVSAGCEVLDFGVCPTPILQFSVRSFGAAGAISISGGHHPMGWNSLTLLDSDGAVLSPLGGENVLDVFHAGDFLRRDWQSLGSVREIPQAEYAEPYFAEMTGRIHVQAIREAAFRILIDPVGGAGCAFLEAFSRHFGCRWVAINGEPSGYLAREAEPRPRSAAAVAAIIGPLECHAGFVFSSDMGRMSLATEKGEPASEEYTFAVIANHVLSKKAGTVVTNCCTSRMVDDLAIRQKSQIVKTPVGQAHIVQAMMDEQAVIGGEGSGSVALAEFSPAFDGFLMMALVLEAMAEQKCRLSELIHVLPRYHIVKRSLPCPSERAHGAVESLKSFLVGTGGGPLDFTDGIRQDFDDGWVHVRSSQTEPMIRVISEGRHRIKAQQRADEMIRILEQKV